MFVLPLSESTVNLSTPLPFSTTKNSLFARSLSVLLILVSPSTSKVPMTSVLPLSVSTVNLLALLPFLTLKNSPFAETFNVSVMLVSPSTVKVPAVTVLPVALSTVNLSVVPFLTAKSASTSTVLLNSVVPVTTRVLPRVVAASTFNVEFNSV